MNRNNIISEHIRKLKVRQNITRIENYGAWNKLPLGGYGNKFKLLLELSKFLEFGSK